MRKILFALQVSAAIAFIPVYAASEMNHGTTVKTQAVEKAETHPSASVSSIAIFPVAALALSSVALNETQKCSNDNCTCKNCKCGSTCTCKDY